MTFSATTLGKVSQLEASKLSQENPAMKTGSASFSLKFEGPALDAHVMMVDDLAPSLMALSAALTALNKAVNKDEAKVELSINTVKAGSFGIDFFS